MNCNAPLVLTSRLVPGMVERGRGAVVFSGSAAGHQPIPFHGVYAATKAFDLFLGEALFVELRDKGVDVIVLEPATTETEFQEAAGEVAHGGAPAAEVVRVALENLGGPPSVIPGWFNWLRANFAQRIGTRPLTAYIARSYMLPRTPSDMQ